LNFFVPYHRHYPKSAEQKKEQGFIHSSFGHAEMIRREIENGKVGGGVDVFGWSGVFLQHLALALICLGSPTLLTDDG
jgi:hypothetical protein